MTRQLKIFLAGLLVVVPFAITVWILWTAGLWVEKLGANIVLVPLWDVFGLQERWPLENIHGVGAILLLVAVYLTGLMTHFWLFRKVLSLVESIIERVPGVKTIYESVRDLMKLFGSQSNAMGRVVEYLPPGSDVGVLGILTNEQPSGTGDDRRAAVYFPLAYMIGGPVLFVKTEHLRDVDMPVERALRLCATAQVSVGKNAQAAINAVTPKPGTGKAEKD